jgi:hypothetical protein
VEENLELAETRDDELEQTPPSLAACLAAYRLLALERHVVKNDSLIAQAVRAALLLGIFLLGDLGFRFLPLHPEEPANDFVEILAVGVGVVIPRRVVLVVPVVYFLDGFQHPVQGSDPAGRSASSDSKSQAGIIEADDLFDDQGQVVVVIHDIEFVFFKVLPAKFLYGLAELDFPD